MSLPETIWCCQTHPHNGHECKGRCLSRRKKCPCELRIAGPDDLLIRRGVVEAWLRMANNGETFDLEYHLEQALAALEEE